MGKNIALKTNGASIAASSIHSNERRADMLIDGSNYTNAHTAGAGNNEWFEVNFGSTKTINRIVIINRKDCCQDRAIGLQLQLLIDDPTASITGLGGLGGLGGSMSGKKKVNSVDITTTKPFYAWYINNEGTLVEDTKFDEFTLGNSSITHNNKREVLGTLKKEGKLKYLVLSGRAFDQNWGNNCSSFTYGIMRNNEWVVNQGYNIPRPEVPVNLTLIPTDSNKQLQVGDQVVIELSGWYPGCSSNVQNMSFEIYME